MNLYNTSFGCALNVILSPYVYGPSVTVILHHVSLLLHVVIEYSLSSNTALNHVQPEASAVKTYGLLPVIKLLALSNHHENWNHSFAFAVNVISSQTE
jgi:hypothetical protein